MCVDHGFAVPLAVALASLDRQCAGEAMTVHVVHPGFGEDVRRRIEAPLVSLDVSWIRIDEASLSGVHFTERLSAAASYRLLLGELLPAGLERVLYLDADIIVVAPLDDLYDLDLGGATIAAVRDAPSPWIAGLGTPWRALGLAPTSPNFNTGVLLIDLVTWRRDSVGERALDILRRLKPKWGDQDALNAVLEGHWLEVSRRWNLQTDDLTGESPSWAVHPEDIEAAIADPAIIHFTGPVKPWLSWGDHPKRDEWYAWLDRTAWGGWRPAAARDPALYRIARAAMHRIRDRRARQRSRGAALPD